MRKGRVLLLSAGAFFVLAVFSIPSLVAQAVGELKTNEALRTDLVRIESMSVFGKLELPPVTFQHDKHTAAVEKAGKDCKTCHLEKDGQMLAKFKREKDTTQSEVKNVYHANCIGCHIEAGKKGQKTGPLDGSCRSCHNVKSKIISAKQPSGFSTALHYRHSESKEIPSGLKDAATGEAVKNNCNRCHHEYNKETKKTFYAKGKEGTCRYCHLEKPTKDVRSMSEASHAACVNCHKDLLAKGKKETGPILCAGCHSKEAQEKIQVKNKEAVAKAPQDTRLIFRQQPDLALVTVNKPAEGTKPVFMSPVVFNHKTHEKLVDNCRTCHHKGMESCSKECHTLQGSKEGNFVQLEQAMHLASSNKSCVGCHNQSKQDAKCAGCHDLMKARSNPSQDACKKCHIQGKLIASAVTGQPKLVGPAEANIPNYWAMKPEEKQAAAAALLKDRAEKANIFTVDDIPEKVVIKHIANDYEASEMPHRKIVLKLAENIKDSKMSGVFHSDSGTLCQACHHNGLAGEKKPAKCVNCHGKPFDSKQPNRPGLKAAYHGQCMSCHKSMALKKPVSTDCVGCHKEKKK